MRKMKMKTFTILTAIAVSLPMIFCSSDVVFGQQSSNKNITVVMQPINDPDDDIRNSFSDELAELLRGSGYEK